MAEKAFSAKRFGRWLRFEWLAVTESDTFQEIYLNDNVTDILMEVEGTFGSATITLKQWVVTEAASFAAVDPGGSAISIATSSKSIPVRDAFPFMRPLHSGGTGETMDVRIHMKTRI